VGQRGLAISGRYVNRAIPAKATNGPTYAMIAAGLARD